MGGPAPMTYALVTPAALEKAIDRMAEELGVSSGALLEALTPVVIGWAIARISETSGSRRERPGPGSPGRSIGRHDRAQPTAVPANSFRFRGHPRPERRLNRYYY